MEMRSRLLTVLRGKKADCPPWFADLSYIYFSLSMQNKLEEKYLGDQGYLKFYQDLGAGICFYPPFLWHTAYEGGVIYSQKVTGNTRTSCFNTPIGSIMSEERYVPSNFSWAYTKHFVENIDDLRIMLYIHENAVHTPDYDAFERIDRLWGASGIPTAIAPISVAPIQKLFARWAGVANTVSIYAEHTDEFESIMKGIENSEDKIFEIICASKADYVEFPENLSSEITGRNFFAKYNKPYYQRRIEQLHQSGKFVGIHIDGTLKGCLQLLGECGFDVAEAVTPQPFGDLHPEEIRKTAGEGIVIWGGLPGGIFTPSFSDVEFEDYVVRILETFRHDAKFVLGVADQVPPDGNLARVKKISQIINKLYH